MLRKGSVASDIDVALRRFRTSSSIVIAESRLSEYQILAVFAAFVFLYSIVASRLEKTRFSGALVYVICGLLLGPSVLGVVDLNVDSEALKSLAEITLAVVLFSDSATANLPVLCKIKRLPAKLLLIGLPITILFGFGAGTMIYPNLGWVEIAVLATMLAPTDAALGKAVISNESVPDSVREGLNVESGLNDGICVPVLLLFLSLAAGSTENGEILSQMIRLPLEEIGIGAAVGIAFAVPGSRALSIRPRSVLGIDRVEFDAVIALAILCFATAQRLGGSGFIASFVGGMTFGGLIKHGKDELMESAEGSGDVLSMITWFVFGAMFMGECLRNPDWRPILYGLLSLTIVRMVPVYLCTFGGKLRPDTRLFLGWFGPRGLASIVFIVMVKEAKVPGADLLVDAVTWTVLLSVILHGVTANPFSAKYAARVSARSGDV